MKDDRIKVSEREGKVVCKISVEQIGRSRVKLGGRLQFLVVPLASPLIQPWLASVFEMSQPN